MRQIDTPTFASAARCHLLQKRRARHASGTRLGAAAVAAVLLAWSPLAWMEAWALPAGYIAQVIPSSALGHTLANQLNDNGLVTGFVHDLSGSGSMFAWSAQTGLTPMANAGASFMRLNNGGLLLHNDSLREDAWVAKQLAPVSGGLTVTNVPFMLQTTAGESQPFVSGLNNQGWTVGESTVGNGAGAVWGSSVWRADGTRATWLEKVRLEGINDQGVAYGFLMGNDGRETRSLVSWSQAAGLQTLAPLSGESWHLSASDSGALLLSGAGGQAYTWSAAAGLASLSAPPGAYVGHINDQGLIVGEWGLGAPPGRQGAFVIEHGVVTDLRDMVLRFDGTGALSGPIVFDRAMDINDQGQILLLGHEGAMAMSFLLSPCTRCGQITPNPNPSGSTILVDSGWLNAFNGEQFRNRGDLVVLQQQLVNRAGASLVNQGGHIRILADGVFVNEGVLEIQPAAGDAGLTVAGGVFYNNSGGSVVIGGAMRVDDGRVRNQADWTIGANVVMKVMPQGIFENQAQLALKADGYLDLEGRLENDGEVRLAGLLTARVGSVVTNRGNFAVGPGTFQQGALGFSRSGIDLSDLGAGALRNLGEFTNQGQLAVTGIGDKPDTWFYNSGRFVNSGSVDIGSVYLPSPGRVIEVHGRFVNAGEVVNSGLFETRDVVGAQSFDQQGFRYSDRNEGLFSNSGTVTIRYPFINGEAGRIDNSRVWTVSTPRFVNDGLFQNQAGALLSVSTGAELLNNQRIENSGVLSIAAGGSLNNSGQLIVGGTGLPTVNGNLLGYGSAGAPVVIAGGTLGGSGRIEGDVQITPLADVHFEVGEGTLEFVDDAGGGHFVLLSGELVPAESLGTITPGNSPGTLTILGNLSGTMARLQIEVVSASLFDRLVVSGEAAFNHAVVTLQFQNGYSPDLNDTFAWLSGGSVSGADTLHYRVSGLAAGWRLDPAGLVAGEIGVWNDAAAQIAPNPNGGLLPVAAGAQAFNAEGFVNRGTIAVAGALANRAGATLAQEDVGLLQVLAGGRFSNRGLVSTGSMDNQGVVDNRPDGVVDIASLTNQSGGRVVNGGLFTVRSAATNQAAGTVENVGHWMQQGVFHNAGTVENTGHWQNLGRIVNAGTFVVGGRLDNVTEAGSTRFVTENFGAVHNSGQFIVTATGLVAGGGYFQQTSLGNEVLRVDGRFEASRFDILGGTVTGSGRLVGDVALVNPSTVAPGDPVGTLTIDGNLTVSNFAWFAIDLASGGSFDSLVVQGDAVLAAGRVEFRLVGGFDPFAMGMTQSFKWLSVDGDASGLANLQWSVVAEPWGPGNGIQTVADANGIYVTAPAGFRVALHGGQLDFQAVPVPEPETWAMLLAGLGLVVWMAKRRRMH